MPAALQPSLPDTGLPSTDVVFSRCRTMCNNCLIRTLRTVECLDTVVGKSGHLARCFLVIVSLVFFFLWACLCRFVYACVSVCCSDVPNMGYNIHAWNKQPTTMMMTKILYRELTIPFIKIIQARYLGMQGPGSHSDWDHCRPASRRHELPQVILYTDQFNHNAV